MACKIAQDSFPHPTSSLIFSFIQCILSVLLILASLQTSALVSILLHHELRFAIPLCLEHFSLRYIHKACSLTHSGLPSNVISPERPPLFTLPVHVNLYSFPPFFYIALIAPDIYLSVN